MSERTYSDAINTRAVFRVYAVIAWATGALLVGWGPLLVGVDLPGLPFAKAGLVRVLGAIVIAAGCVAHAIAGADDPGARRRVLLWWAIAHGVVLVVTALQVATVGNEDDPVAVVVVGLLLLLTMLCFYFWQTAEGYPLGGLRSVSSTFGLNERVAVERLRSTYEVQIRSAAAQEERNRLARDLHDSIKQQIFVIQTAAATAQARIDSDRPGAVAALEQVRTSAHDAMTEMEAMLDQLRAVPLENRGLVAALKKQCEALQHRTGAIVRFDLGPLCPSEALRPGVQEAVFRIAQEAMSNIARHARAAHVTVALGEADGDLVLAIEDDGLGFDAVRASAGMGIGNMRARADGAGGRLELRSAPGQGTSWRLRVPCLPHRMSERHLHRRRALIWGALSAAFTGFSVVSALYPATRPRLMNLVPAALFCLVVCIRLAVAYRRLFRRLDRSA
jgi:signal transduction histidine kinase